MKLLLLRELPIGTEVKLVGDLTRARWAGKRLPKKLVIEEHSGDGVIASGVPLWGGLIIRCPE